MGNGVHYEKSGLSPYRPDRESIPGHSQENVLDLGSAVRAALADPRSLGKKVLILDETAGYLAFGLAEARQRWLRGRGGHPAHGRRGGFRTSEMPFLFGRLARANVRTAAQEMIDRIEGDRAEIPGIWIAARAPFRALILLSLQ